VADVEHACPVWRKTVWRKSSASSATDCAEVAAAGGSVLIRDSKNRDGAVLSFPPATWSCFLAGVRTGDTGPA
jgi:uncharacterized protein DUF397